MTYTALKDILPNITSLGLFQRLSALAIPVTRTEVIETETSSIEVKKTYPVGWGISDTQCWDQGRYKELIPDHSYISLGYFEEVGGLTPDRNADQHNLLYTGQVRFVFWANIPKLNLNDAGNTTMTVSDNIAMAVIDAVQDRRTVISDAQFINSYATLRDAKVEQKSAAIFSKYSYENVEALLLWPYDFGAVTFTLRIEVPRGCVQPITAGTPIDCILV